MLQPLAILALVVTLAPPPSAAEGVGRGQDPFDTIRSIDELRAFETQVKETVRRVRPAVVQLRLWSGRGGSTGTGVVINSDGLVATCGHVGARAGQRVEATLADGTVLRGRTLGQANEGALDCGLLQLETHGRSLDSAPLGTSKSLAEGDWLLAMGYTQGPPEEARPALLRVGRVLRNTTDEVLFDAPIDAGDSGGPSFNLRGEVVALNSRCGRQPWENAATPIDRLRERMDDMAGGLDESAFHLGESDSTDSVRTQFASGASPDGRLAVQRSVPLAGIAAPALQSVVRVMDGSETKAYATVVDASGLAVTKLSQLPDQLPGSIVVVETGKGTRMSAEVVGRDPTLDLALISITNSDLPAISFSNDTRVRPGEVLLSARLGPNGPALGFAAIERKESERDADSMPYLGVRSEPVTLEEAKQLGVKMALRVDEVVPDTAAAAAGIRIGDHIIAIDGAALGGRNALRRAIGEHQAGDVIALEVVRGEERKILEATLARRGGRDRPAKRGNTTTPISKVSTGFGSVIAHDGNLWPEQCGGPILDLDGNVIGINIARFDRTSTHALSADRVRGSIARMRAETPVSAPTVPAARRSPPSEAAP